MLSIPSLFLHRYKIMFVSILILIIVGFFDIYGELRNNQTKHETNKAVFTALFSNELSRSLTFYGDRAKYRSLSEVQNYLEDKHSASSTVILYTDQQAKQMAINYPTISTAKSIERLQVSGEPIWRTEVNSQDHSLILIAGLIEAVGDKRYFVETRFYLNEYSYTPITAYLEDSKVLFINQDNDILIQETNNINVATQINTNTLSLSNGNTFRWQEESLFNQRYFTLNGISDVQYQVITVDVPSLGGTLFALYNISEQFVDIKNDIFEFIGQLIFALTTVVMLFFASSYFKKSQTVMYTDALTGLHNRYHLNRLERRATKSSHSGTTAVLALDIDYFKRVNDTYGHAVGDSVLERFAQIMQHNMRKDDVCYRLGGEEFAILLDVQNKETAVVLANRLRESIKHDRKLSELVDGGITTSIGVAFLENTQSFDSAFEIADKFLYQAKESGRDKVIYDGSIAGQVMSA